MEYVRDFMTRNPACCTTKNTLQEVAAMMIKHDCGEIPVVESLEDMQILGVVTDRDICCRAVGKGLNPLGMRVNEVMTFPAVIVNEDTALERCVELMEKNQIRRIPVVDGFLRVIGIVSLADIARKQSRVIPDLMRDVSRPKENSLQ